MWLGVEGLLIKSRRESSNLDHEFHDAAEVVFVQFCASEDHARRRDESSIHCRVGQVESDVGRKERKEEEGTSEPDQEPGRVDADVSSNCSHSSEVPLELLLLLLNHHLHGHCSTAIRRQTSMADSSKPCTIAAEQCMARTLHDRSRTLDALHTPSTQSAPASTTSRRALAHLDTVADSSRCLLTRI